MRTKIQQAETANGLFVWFSQAQQGRKTAAGNRDWQREKPGFLQEKQKELKEAEAKKQRADTRIQKEKPASASTGAGETGFGTGTGMETFVL